MWIVKPKIENKRNLFLKNLVPIIKYSLWSTFLSLGSTHLALLYCKREI